MAGLPQADMKKVVWTSDVYEPSDDSFLLVDAVASWLKQMEVSDEALPTLCLEVGCGSGYVICSVALALQHVYCQKPSQQTEAAVQQQFPTAEAASHQPRHASCQCDFVATDINPAALHAAAQTLGAHGLHGVRLVQTDLVTALLPEIANKVDLLLFNPPYVPTPDEEVLREGIAQAWAGGHLGRRVTDRLLVLLPQLLSPRGQAFIITVAENKPQEIIGMLAGMGLTAHVALSRGADEECLQVLHVRRRPGVPAAVAADEA